MMNDALPSVAEMPVLPNVRESMKADLVYSKQNNMMYVFMDRLIAEEPNYVLYNPVSFDLEFVTVEGRLCHLGVAVHAPLREVMEALDMIKLVYVRENGLKAFLDLPMIFQTQ